MKLDLSLKQPDNVLEAQKIFEQIESMSALERSVPDLKKYRESISQRFIQSTQSAFDHIQRTFNLQDRAVYQVKRELKDLEQIRREYEDLHPAKVYLSKQDYHSIEILDKDISELTKKQNYKQNLRKMKSFY